MTTVVCSVKWISDAETFHPQTRPFKIISWHFHSCKCKCLLIHGDLKHVKNPGCSQLFQACYSIITLCKTIFYSSFFIPLLVLKNSIRISSESEKRWKKVGKVESGRFIAYDHLKYWTGEILWARTLENYLEFYSLGPRRRIQYSEKWKYFGI